VPRVVETEKMKKSTNRTLKHHKLVIERETIAILATQQLSNAIGGGTWTLLGLNCGTWQADGIERVA